MSRIVSFTDFLELIKRTEHSDLTANELAELLYPVFESVDFLGRSLLISVNTDNLPPDGLNRLYAYADWLRHLGAKNVVFLPQGAIVETIQFSSEDYYTLKLDERSILKSAEILDWLRIAGADPNKIIILGPGNDLRGESNGNSEN